MGVLLKFAAYFQNIFFLEHDWTAASAQYHKSLPFFPLVTIKYCQRYAPFCRRYSLCRSHKGKYDSKISRVLIDLPKINTLNRTTAAVCRELIKEIKWVTYKIYDPESLFTLKQHEHEHVEHEQIIHKSIFIKCRPFYTDRNKTKKMPTKNQSIPNYQFQNERNQS